MLNKEQKKDIVKDLVEKIKSSKAVVFSDFKGLSVKDMTNLRGELYENQADFMVVKKTLINIALKEAGIDMDVKKIEGQIALAISQQDEVVVAKILDKVAKANENLKIVAGILGDNVLSDQEVQALAKLPSKEELLAKVVGSINAPVSGFVNVLAGNIRGIVQIIKSISEKKA